MMKKILVFIIFGLFFIACEKDSINNGDDPPLVAKTAEVTVKFGPLPESSGGIAPIRVVFADKDGKGFTFGLENSHFRYPKFTYKFTDEQAEKYLGEKVIFYFSACRNLTVGVCWGMDVYVPIDPLKEKNEIYIEIPDRDN